MGYTLQELADAVGGTVHGQSDIVIDRVATIRNANSDSISFLANRSYYKYLSETHAAAIILAAQDLEKCPVAAIVVKNPYLAYAKISTM